MEKKSWQNPEMVELGVERTEFGNTVTTSTDFVWHVNEYITLYSFS
jgi:hypothetical protein